MNGSTSRKMRAVAVTSLSVAAVGTVAAACQPIVPYTQSPAVSMSSGPLHSYRLLAGGGFKAGSTVHVVEQYVVGGRGFSSRATTAIGTVDSAGRFNLSERLMHSGNEHYQVYGTSWKGGSYVSAVNVFTS